MQQYRRVTYGVRCQINAYLKTKISISQIAKLTGYHKSTIYRELRRNSSENYDPVSATVRAQENFIKCRKRRRINELITQQTIEKYLQMGWSPEQVAGRLKRQNILIVSRQTIYNSIDRDFPEWKQMLRRYGKRRGGGRWARRRFYPAWRQSIHDRPEKINNRKQLGHWERDTMFVKDRKQLIVFLERKSRYIKIAKVKEPYCIYLTNQMKEMMREVNTKVLSLTNDNGNEFLDAEQFNVPVYYCDPRSPHQKGSVENSIGLLRQYITRKTDINTITEAELLRYQNSMNHRPRKCLDYRTPHEVLYGKKVALAS